MIDQDKKHSYADQCCRGVSFTLEDLIFLKVSPIKGGVRFGDEAS